MSTSNIPKLELFKYDTCPFCVRVIRGIEALGMESEVAYRDTRRDPAAKAELLKVGGKTQVPCLFIDGEPLYESSDIMNYLQGVAAQR